MSNESEASPEATFPMRVVSRLTGLSPERLRAWESRYGAIRPLRSEGGTRYYTRADLERLRLLRDAVGAGHRIGSVAKLDTEQLRARLPAQDAPGDQRFAAELAALERLDAVESRRLLVERMEAMGAAEFASDYVLPLVYEIGVRWHDGRISIAAEHLASGIMRSLLGAALSPDDASQSGPSVVFATPPGEFHDIGLLVAALTAMEAGANPLFLGANVPEDELLSAVARTRASALALGIVTVPPADVEPLLRRVRAQLPSEVAIWTGGFGAKRCAAIEGIEQLATLEQLSASVARSCLGGRAKVVGIETARRGEGAEPS